VRRPDFDDSSVSTPFGIVSNMGLSVTTNLCVPSKTQRESFPVQFAE